jgi:TusA-related sulfurtransferase
MKTGDILKLHVDDPAGIVDVPYYCNETNNKIIETTINNQNQIYLIIKG